MTKVVLTDETHLRKEKAPQLAGKGRSEDGKSGKLDNLIVEHRNFDCKTIEVAFLAFTMQLLAHALARVDYLVDLENGFIKFRETGIPQCVLRPEFAPSGKAVK